MTQPPVTGDARIDDALTTVVDLADVPLAEHAARLAHVHDVVNAALQNAPLVALPGTPGRPGPR